MLFDRICGDNGIATGSLRPGRRPPLGRSNGSTGPLRRELLTDHRSFTDLAAAQAAIDTWVDEYNTDRPYQSLDMDTPASRFTAERECDELLPLRLPAALRAVTSPEAATDRVAPVEQPESSRRVPAARVG